MSNVDSHWGLWDDFHIEPTADAVKHVELACPGSQRRGTEREEPCAFVT